MHTQTKRLNFIYPDRPWIARSPVKPVEVKSFTDSSSTPTVPFSTADLLYNGEVNRQLPAEDFSATDLVYFDREKDKHKLKEIDPPNRRPTSRNNSRRSISLEKVNFDGEKEELRPIKNTLPAPKQNHVRSTGLRASLLKNDQILNQKNNVSLSGREPDDLVAMGTIWSPNLQRNSVTTTTATTTTSSKSFSLGSSSNTTVPPRKGPSVTTATRQIFVGQNASTSRSFKDGEPKYADPLPGAPASFQQRLMELSALESETVRWERTKKVKKKSKQDRDS